MKIYYNDNYNSPEIEFETFQKSRHVAELLSKNSKFTICDPESASKFSDFSLFIMSLLERNIAPEYLNAIISGEPISLARSNGLGWDKKLYAHVVASLSGIVRAVQDAVSGFSDSEVKNTSASLSSGLHHARYTNGSAFCTVNSLAIAAIYTSETLGLNTTIIDFDAHCGGGTWDYIKKARSRGNGLIRQIDLSTSSFDAYDVSGTSLLDVVNDNDAEYLARVDKMLACIDEDTDIVFYNAGVDVFPNIAKSTVIEREFRTAIATRAFPTVVVLAGGYGDMKDIAPLHVATLEAFATRHLGAPRRRRSSLTVPTWLSQ